jgi:uncharacterized protein (DUF362 family)
MSSIFTSCCVHRANGVLDYHSLCADVLPDRSFSHIAIKPNWVKHQENPAFPIEAMVTSSDLIEAVVDVCLERYPTVRRITVGDVPLQSCDWNLLVRQAGIDRLINKYGKYTTPRIEFLDLRRERCRLQGGFMVSTSDDSHGDPRGYQEVTLDRDSQLEAISGSSSRFRVSDYDPQETASSHRSGYHRYLIARSALDCDLFINLPKMKTHQKAGITGALKNLVGINGNKAFLVHHRYGSAKVGGDEFPPDIARVIVLQNRLRDMVQNRSRVSFRALRAGWRVLRRLAGIHVEGTGENLNRKFYIGSGSWYGNDTVWRMIYDLNRIIRYARSSDGQIDTLPQRDYVAILDGVIAGEGNGPLQALPVSLGILAASQNPFLLDTVMAQLMGFDPAKIPMLARRRDFADPVWGDFDENTVPVLLNDKVHTGIRSLPVLHRFRPSPGWRGHIENTAIEGCA